MPLPNLKTQEDLLTIWFDSTPSAKCPYVLYGCPPMWETIDFGNGYVLFTRPGKTMERPAPFMPYREVDGVHYQLQRDGKWHDQGHQASFGYFFGESLPKLVEKYALRDRASEINNKTNYRLQTGNRVLLKLDTVGGENDGRVLVPAGSLGEVVEARTRRSRFTTAYEAVVKFMVNGEPREALVPHAALRKAGRSE